MEELERQAREFARAAHAGRAYAGGRFYDKHLARVVATLRRFGITDACLLAARDRRGYGRYHIEDVRRAFGDDVADLVVRLTDEPGRSRKERHRRTHGKIRGRSEAVCIKLADRVANVQSSIAERSHLRGMYRAEYPQPRERSFYLERSMSDHVYKIIELAGSSTTGIEDAVKNAVTRAAQTVRNMRWFEVVETRGHIENNGIAHWQVTVKIGFTLDDQVV